MIKLLALLFVSNSLFASTALVIQRSSSKGGEQKAVIFETTELRVLRNSSVYDDTNDYRLGQLKGKKSDEVAIFEERLKQISKSLVAAEKILAKKKTSFTGLDQHANPHGDKMYLDKILITEGSSYYQELRKFITGLDTTGLELVDGARLSKGKKEIETIINGKVASKEEFIIPFFCDQPKFPAKCQIRDQGFLYIK